MTVHLFMGKEFDHAHEMRALRKFVGEMQERFGAREQYYFILANYFVGGKEIDLTVLKENAIIVIELKECGDSPVTGAENGDWIIHNPDGTYTVINPGRENPYQQVSSYRRAWASYLDKRCSTFVSGQKARQMNFWHVSAFVAFSPELDPSSEINIEYQPWFGVVGLDELCDAIYDQRSPALSFTTDELTALAESVLGLKRIDVQTFLGVRVPEPPRPPVPPEAIVSVEQWTSYCQALVDEHENWTELLVLPVDALHFVPARLIPAEKAGTFPAVTHIHEITPTHERSPMTMDACVRSTKGPLIVLGGPGQGKTAALESLAVTYARETIKGTGERAPILVKLSRYDQKNRDLLSLITMSLRSRGLRVDRQQVERLLEYPGIPLLLLFDGLDEVRASERLNVKQDLESLLLSHPSHKVIITCRTADYDGYALRLEGGERWELCQFDEQDIRKFLIDYYWHVERTTQKGRLLFEQLRQQGLLDFAQTPLHLGLVVGLAESQEGLPENRGQLYERFVDMVLRLEAGKGKTSAEWMQIERFLAHLALVMHEQETRQISLQMARQALNQYWQELWEVGACSLHRDQVLDLVWNSRLLVKTEGDAAFRHAVLQDYFAAKRLEYMVEDAEEDLYRYIGEPHWDEAVALLAGMADDASALVEFISRKESPLLTLKCLANAKRLDDFARTIVVERLLDQLFDQDILAAQFTRLILEAPSILQPADELRRHLAPVWADRLLSAEPFTQEMVILYETCTGSFSTQALTAALESADTGTERARSAFILGFLGSEDSVDPLINCLSDENPDLRYSTIEALGRRGDPKAIEALKPLLHDTDSDVRQVTITVLGALCGADVSPPPTSFLEAVMPLTSRQQVDSEVIKEVKQWLRLALSDPDDQVRAEAAIVLGCLGEAQVLDTLIELLAEKGLDQCQRTRMARALSHLGSQDALDSITDFFDEMYGLVLPGGMAFHHPGNPVRFEITAALVVHRPGWIGPLLEMVSYWKTEGLKTPAENGDSQAQSLLWHRLDRMRWYREKLAPAIVDMGMDVLFDLFESIQEAHDGGYSAGAGAEARHFLRRIRESADVGELIQYLRDAARRGPGTQASWRGTRVEYAIYIVGEHCASWTLKAEDPLLDALREDSQLVQLFIEVYQQSGWGEVRSVAARALAHYVRLVGRDTLLGVKIHNEVINPWLEEVDREHEQAQYAKGLILSLCGDLEAIPLLYDLLEADEVEIRYRAAHVLLHDHGDERAIGTVIGMLHDKDTNKRIAAAVALEDFDTPEVIAAFADALRDPDSSVRLIAVRVLAKRGDESVVEPLSQALNDDDSWIRDRVIEALAKIDGQQAVEALSDVVTYHEDGHTRRSALEALATIGDPAGLDAFRQALKDGDSSVEHAARWGLESWAREESNVEHLQQIYHVMKEDESIHNEVCRIFLLVRLGNIGTPEAIRAMEDALQDPHEMVRLTAIAGLKEYGTVDSLAALRRMAEEDTGVFQDKPLADAAREAIEQIQKRDQMLKE